MDMALFRREVFLEIFDKVVGFLLKTLAFSFSAAFAGFRLVIGLLFPIMSKRFAFGCTATLAGFWFGASSLFPIVTERLAFRFPTLRTGLRLRACRVNPFMGMPATRRSKGNKKAANQWRDLLQLFFLSAGYL